MRIIATQLRADGTREKGLIDVPEPAAPVGKQVKTRTLCSGMTNGSERNDLVRGNYARADKDLPAGWGYQNVGEVIAVGPDATKLKVGDVIYSSCDHVEFAVLEEDWLNVKLPAEVDRREAALFGMTSVAMRTCRHADMRMGERVLIVGAGIIGQVAAQIADAMGARVDICDVNEERLAMARAIGAAERAVNTAGDGWQREIQDATYAVVIDLAGVPGMEDKLIAAAQTRGRVVWIAGRHEVKYTFNWGQGREITMMQNSHFDNDDLANLCRLVARGKVRIKPLLKDVVPVADCKPIYDMLRDTPDRLLGTVFVW